MITTVRGGLLQFKLRIQSLKENIAVTDEIYAKNGMKKHLKKMRRKRKLYLKQRGRCCFCNKLTFLTQKLSSMSATIEHVKPKSQMTAPLGIHNYKISCYPCNNARGTYPFDEFMELRKTHTPGQLAKMIQPKKYPPEYYRAKKEKARLWREAHPEIMEAVYAGRKPPKYLQKAS